MAEGGGLWVDWGRFVGRSMRPYRGVGGNARFLGKRESLAVGSTEKIAISKSTPRSVVRTTQLQKAARGEQRYRANLLGEGPHSIMNL